MKTIPRELMNSFKLHYEAGNTELALQIAAEIFRAIEDERTAELIELQLEKHTGVLANEQSI